MPGAHDPTGTAMPQQPLHFSMFPAAYPYSSFHTVTNPYECTVNSCRILTTSGQNVDDVFKYIDSDERLSIAELMLKWAHVAPTAPDTLWCFPFKDKDPFILDTLPNVLVIGNQPKFETSLVKGSNGKTRVVLVPSFAESGTLVLLNVKTLECTSLTFEIKNEE
ncbi:DNA polymerase delta subunit 2 [Nowakowskiella sp. JEL0078]|nr:DNA polymerase delta subunit 2 [Nowakowskiella sp. JEL0078]